MKKTLLTTLAVFLALVPAFAGTFSKTYDFKDFTGISASHVFHVDLRPSSSFSVKVEAPDYLEPYLNVRVDHKQLILSVKDLPKAINKRLSDEKSGFLRAVVTMPVLESVSLSGAAKLQADGVFPDLGGRPFRLSLSGATHADGLAVSSDRTEIKLSGASHASLKGSYDRVVLEASGASKARFDVRTLTVDAELSGSARLDLEGEFDRVSIEASGASQAELKSDKGVTSLDIECSGASSVESRQAKAMDVNVELSGASKCRVSALRRLSVEASGASTCYYEGGPDTKVEAVQISRGSTLKKL